MEVWRDYQTGKFFSINGQTGLQNPSNRYGSEHRVFTAYSTGFPHIGQGKAVPIDKLYTVQPKKFDGYCQFPRPSERSSSKSPYIRRVFRTEKVHIKDESKIPQPLEFLNMSQASIRNFSPKRSSASMNIPEQMMTTIHDIKLSMVEKPLSYLRTALDLSVKLEYEKNNNNKGYVRPKSKANRRKMKGFFLKQFKTSGELYLIEKKIREKTNPMLVQKNEHFEKVDREMLEKKRNATKMMQNVKN